MNQETIASEFEALQARICSELENIDGLAKFSEDKWDRAEGGGGKTRIIQNGNVIEKGGVAFSKVFGPVSETMKTQMGLDGDFFFASGVSIVLHAKSPHIPIIHMNVRYFQLDSGEYWFGGGIDLTPHYIISDQAKEFHQGLKVVCDRYNDEFYWKFKPWADDYFFNIHRNETRGIGGIFFDRLNDSCGVSKDSLFEFCIDLGMTFPKLYEQQVIKGKDLPISDHQIKWRNLRRGRYVEFNLVYDKGTKFGLVSGGRTESILMSLPPDASWEYNHQPEFNSPERKTLDSLIKGINWL